MKIPNNMKRIMNKKIAGLLFEIIMFVSLLVYVSTGNENWFAIMLVCGFELIVTSLLILFDVKTIEIESVNWWLDE